MISDYSELLSILNAHHVKYLVVGAYAVAIHAQPRGTKDLDILVKADPENAKMAFAALAEFGAPLGNITPADFAQPGPFFRMGREPVGIDILTASPASSLTPHGSGGSKQYAMRRRMSGHGSFRVKICSPQSGPQDDGKISPMSKQ